MKASSMDSCSTMSTLEAINWKTRLDAASYTDLRGVTRTAE